MSAARWISAGLVVFAVVAGAGLWLQHETSAALRGEIRLLQDERKTLERLRAEHQRLIAAQVSDAELARLRSDRAALMRLRDEIERMKSRAEQMGSAEPAAQKSAHVERPVTPALTLHLGVQQNGNLKLDGTPVDLNHEIRQRLAALRRGDFVKVRFDAPDAPYLGFMKQRVNELMALAKEFGLRMEVVFDGVGG